MKMPTINRIGVTTDGGPNDAYAIQAQEDWGVTEWWAACQTCMWEGEARPSLDIAQLDADYAGHDCKGPNQ